jgi:tight adherence protein B
METVIPIVMLFLMGTLALVLYGGHRREEIARNQELSRRLQRFVPRRTAAAVDKPQLQRPRPLGPAVAVAMQSDILRDLDRWLTQGGVKTGAVTFIVTVLVVAGAGAALLSLWLGSRAAALYGLAAGLLPVFYVYSERNKRLEIFSQQLPYVLDFLRSALSAGHTLIRGFQMATENAPEPIATELRLVSEQIRLGSTLSEALDNMFRRVPEESLGFLVAAIRVQAEVGSSVSEILDRVTDTIRERQRLQQEIMTLTAQARMSGMIVAALPFILLGFFTLVRPAYTHPLFHNPMGIRMLKTAIILDALALIIIRRMTRMD